ncbi:protein-disulfide reductase DsbD domain-containing protein [Breoghania sp.]|uniref:protein-disulfide reductase DsbD domain-containing protein n=1 Tax=Breoghania sp. TaxID=2065378 RepID=UPI00261C22FC|nr:protein-disulfide reductase DsbD domain-containing protein [Breoghania sp.]MDJ0930272.1 protein-disulfide reductase DsbD family protein [Breoghania sp.]
MTGTTEISRRHLRADARRTFRLALSAAALGMVLSGPAFAGVGPWFTATGGEIRLIMAGGVPDGEGTYKAALEIRTEPGWKTYWRFPGDSGIGTSADFSASDNVASTALAFPAPERHEDPYSTTIGYEGGAVLPITAKMKSTGDPATLVADVNLGLCREVCVPVTTRLEIPLDPDAPADAVSAQAIAAAEARVPEPVDAGDPLSVTVLSLEPGDEPAFRFTAHLSDADAPADLFVEGPQGSYLSVPTLAERDGAKAIFTLPTEGLVHDTNSAVLRLTLVNGSHAADQSWTVDLSALE